MLAGDFVERFRSDLGLTLRQGVPLSSVSHFRIGGPADFLFEAATEDQLIRSVLFSRERNVACRVIGGGTNMLFDDRGYRGLILINRVRSLRFEPPARLIAASGSTLDELITGCLDQGVGGLEFLVDIPGTVGGAVFGNAGAFDRDIGQVLREASLLTRTAEVARVDSSFFNFSYRHSALKAGRDILLEAVLEGCPSEKSHIQGLLSDYRGKRKNRHPPWDVACAGSYFKNPVLPNGEKVPAAFLLDRVGAKQMQEGDAAVFSGHANFIINRKKATAEQVRSLASRLKERVKEIFDVDLQEEVIYLPAEP